MAFTVTFSDPTGQYTAQSDLFIRNALAAAENWSAYLAPTAGTLDIHFHLVENYPNRGGGRSYTTVFVGTYDELDVYEQGAIYELRTGNDPNGSAPDIEVFFDVDYLTQFYWLDPLDGTPLPPNKVDLMDVIAHELGHALALNGWRDYATYNLPDDYLSTFDAMITVDGGMPFFLGEHAQATYGGAVPLTAGNVYHVGNPSPQPGADLVADIMNGVVFDFHRYEISALDVAILSDLGIPTILDDVLVGRSENDTTYGGEGNDRISGGAGSDTLSGDSGNDSLNGGAQDDQLGGGSGIDTAVFSGLRVSYSLDRGAVQLVVSGTDGTDTLSGIEWLVFDDVTINPDLPNSDFDGSGNSDIIWQNSDGRAAVWLLDGTAPIGAALIGSNPGPEWDVEGSGDFNRDGYSDILWQNDDGRAAVWLLDNTTRIGGAVVGSNPGPQWHIMGSGDFNGDAKSDILWQHSDGSAAVWLLDGSTQIGAAVIGSNPGLEWQAKDTGDFNGDGKSDILWQHNDGRAAVWLLDGTTRIGAAVVGGTPGPQWQVIGSGDFNGDGKSDILWQHDDGRAAVWLLDGTTQIGSAVIGTNPGAQWNVRSSADFDGNAKSDILWQHDNGQAAAWLLNGTSLQSTVLIGVNPGADWLIA
jgi:hypothetical protein